VTAKQLLAQSLQDTQSCATVYPMLADLLLMVLSMLQSIH
jgi:hypothetical protein